MKPMTRLFFGRSIVFFVLFWVAFLPSATAAKDAASDEAWPLSCWFYFEEGFDEIERCARRGPDGQITVDPEVTAASLEAGDVADIRIESRLYFVLASGKTAPALPYDNGADYFVEGLARTVRAGKVGFVDQDLDEVVPAIWDFAFPFESGLARVCEGCGVELVGEHRSMVSGRWGYVDRLGRVVVPLEYSRESLPSREAIDLVSLPTADELLRRSIAFHDPKGRFLTGSWCLEFRESRPDSERDRKTELLIDVPGERFHMVRKDEHEVAGVLDGERCEMTLDGRSDLSDEERQEHGIGCDRLRRLRDYYVYLWGLPMKLSDPGTRLGAVQLTSFLHRSVYGLKVTYSPDVGRDTWTFYFDRQTSELVGYRFHHDEAKNDGEVIVLDGMFAKDGIRLPRARAWFTHQDDRHLGTDVLWDLDSCDEPAAPS